MRVFHLFHKTCFFQRTWIRILQVISANMSKRAWVLFSIRNTRHFFYFRIKRTLVQANCNFLLPKILRQCCLQPTWIFFVSDPWSRKYLIHIFWWTLHFNACVFLSFNLFAPKPADSSSCNSIAVFICDRSKRKQKNQKVYVNRKMCQLG